MKVILSPVAQSYVKSEATYLKSRSPEAARQFVEDLKRLRRSLTRFPDMGSAVPEMPIPGVRRFVMRTYIVDYEIRPGALVILALRHGRQRPPGIGLDDDFDYEDLENR